MRSIDADALIERLKIDSPDPEGVDEWIDIINNVPTVDVLEQIRAEIQDAYNDNKECDQKDVAYGLKIALDIIEEYK